MYSYHLRYALSPEQAAATYRRLGNPPLTVAAKSPMEDLPTGATLVRVLVLESVIYSVRSLLQGAFSFRVVGEAWRQMVHYIRPDDSHCINFSF
jgi:hypothetical protein